MRIHGLRARVHRPFRPTAAVFDCLETFYNRKRRHSSLGYQSPQAFLDSYFQNQKPTLN